MVRTNLEARMHTQTHTHTQNCCCTYYMLVSLTSSGLEKKRANNPVYIPPIGDFTVLVVRGPLPQCVNPRTDTVIDV